jgi:nitric oxide dioxygenase
MYTKGAWDGWKEFKVTKRIDESGSISSLDLVPTDASMLPLKPYKAGQFITVRVWVEALHCFQNRHYSLSDAITPDHYRITVKREDGNDTNPEGIVSSHLHSLAVGSTVQAAFPIGSFVLPDPAPKNLVLFSAGVGITPNLAILNTVAYKDPSSGPNVSWIQGVRNSAEHVFKSHVAGIAERSNGKVRTAAYYSEQSHVENEGEHVYPGRLHVNQMDQSLLALDDPTTLYYVCGPDLFMRDVKRDLEALGVDGKRITIEAFRAGEA